MGRTHLITLRIEEAAYREIRSFCMASALTERIDNPAVSLAVLIIRGIETGTERLDVFLRKAGEGHGQEDSQHDTRGKDRQATPGAIEETAGD